MSDGTREAGTFEAGTHGASPDATGVHLLHRSLIPAEALRYALAGALILAATATVILLSRPGPALEDASEVESAVLIDLPPALASSEPKRDAAERPEQPASQAAAAASAPPPVDPPAPDHDPPAPVPDQPPIDTPPPAPDPAAVLERRVEVPPPATSASATAAPKREEQAPAGSRQPVRTPDAAGEDDQPHASAHAMSLWQRSMVSRLETAKRAVRGEAGRQGLVIVAFAITRAGTLVSARVTRGSGDPSLDAAAKTLIERAAPFPAPPAGVGGKDLSFTVPIRFKR